MPKKKAHFTLRLSWEDRQRMTREAERQQTTPSALGRQLIEQGLDELESGRDPALTRSEGLRILDRLESDKGGVGDDILPILRRVLASLFIQEEALKTLLPEAKKLPKMFKQAASDMEAFVLDEKGKKPWAS